MPDDSLFKPSNPLQERIGESFFENLPTTPGVYKMYGREGQLLYVGKAKNLRNRLFTYRRDSAGGTSRKTVRLIRMVCRIELEHFKTEKEALLRENELIREARPEFNRAKKQPETYYYIYVVPEEDEDEATLSFTLRMHLREELKEHAYGAFKGHGLVRRMMGALLRQLTVMDLKLQTPFKFPSVLMKKLTPWHYDFKAKDVDTVEMHGLVSEFLHGRSNELLYRFANHAQKEKLLEQFIGKVILKDLESLKLFYERCALRNRQMREQMQPGEPLIDQQKLDDYLIELAFNDNEE